MYSNDISENIKQVFDSESESKHDHESFNDIAEEGLNICESNDSDHAVNDNADCDLFPNDTADNLNHFLKPESEYEHKYSSDISDELNNVSDSDYFDEYFKHKADNELY